MDKKYIMISCDNVFNWMSFDTTKFSELTLKEVHDNELGEFIF